MMQNPQVNCCDNCFYFSAASTTLTVKEIQNELSEMAAANWYQLGMQLEIPPAELRTVECNYPHDAQRCMTEVLNRWLRNAPECSWAKLAQAVEAMGGYAVLAEKLKQRGQYQHLCMDVATFHIVT